MILIPLLSMRECHEIFAIKLSQMAYKYLMLLLDELAGYNDCQLIWWNKVEKCPIQWSIGRFMHIFAIDIWVFPLILALNYIEIQSTDWNRYNMIMETVEFSHLFDSHEFNIFVFFSWIRSEVRNPNSINDSQ